MRRFIVLLAIMASALFTLGAGASTASAAGCSMSSGGINYAPASNTLQENFAAYNCVDVDLVEYNFNGGGIKEAMIDASTGNTVHLASAPPTVLDVLCGRTGIAYTGVCYHIVHVHPWCPPMTPHVVYTRARIRWHVRSTNHWITYASAFSANQSIWC